MIMPISDRSSAFRVETIAICPAQGKTQGSLVYHPFHHNGCLFTCSKFTNESLMRVQKDSSLGSGRFHNLPGIPGRRRGRDAATLAPASDCAAPAGLGTLIRLEHLTLDWKGKGQCGDWILRGRSVLGELDCLSDQCDSSSSTVGVYS